MTNNAIRCGGTIDKFIGDAVLVFFGDPESAGDVDDALHCIEMAIQMQKRVGELQKFWKKQGVPKALMVRMGIATGYCTVGNFGSDQRLDYTVLGSPVNLAARLEGLAGAGQIVIDQTTHNLIDDQVATENVGEVTPKGFVRPVRYFQVRDFRSGKIKAARRNFSHVGEHVEVNVIDSSDIRAAIEELKRIQESFEKEYALSPDAAAT